MSPSLARMTRIASAAFCHQTRFFYFWSSGLSGLPVSPTFGLSVFRTIFPYLHPFNPVIILILLKIVNPERFLKINL